MFTTGICEIILYVKDMERQVAFYRDTLGLPLHYPLSSLDWSHEFWVEFSLPGCHLALHGGGTGDHGKDSPKFVFAVEDITVSRAGLLAKGVAIGEVFSPAPGVLVANAQDPEGNPFSLEFRGE